MSESLKDAMASTLRLLQRQDTSPHSPPTSDGSRTLSVRERATPEQITQVIAKVMLDRNAILESQASEYAERGYDVRNRLVIADQAIIQLASEITRLEPTSDQLARMHDRFMRNNNFNDFALFRFINEEIPLYTQQQMEQFVEKKFRSILEQARTAVYHQYVADGRLTYAKEYLFLQDLLDELRIRFHKRTEERKEKERRWLAQRVNAARLWLKRIDDGTKRDIFLAAQDRGIIRPKPGVEYPTPFDYENAWTYAELLLELVESFMRRLPCCAQHTSGNALPPDAAEPSPSRADPTTPHPQSNAIAGSSTAQAKSSG